MAVVGAEGIAVKITAMASRVNFILKKISIKGSKGTIVSLAKTACQRCLSLHSFKSTSFFKLPIRLPIRSMERGVVGVPRFSRNFDIVKGSLKGIRKSNKPKEVARTPGFSISILQEKVSCSFAIKYTP